MKKEAIVVGLALFAMFFGAGNLIFPPFLGLECGSEWWLGVALFVFVDVVISCLGIYAVNAAGGSVFAIEGTLGKVFGMVVNTAAILCTGVLIATPRTAATTFEMGIVPIFGDGFGLFPFSIVFFAIVLLLTLRPTRIVDIVGKVLTPVLVVGIVIMIISGMVNPLGPIQPPITDSVVADGILNGYQTMDILAVVGFAMVVRESVRAQGFENPKTQLSVIAQASLVACLLLTLIYGGLTYLGATSATVAPEGITQAQLITMITGELLGYPGVVILGIVVSFACLTTAIGLTGATATYFERITGGRIKYQPCVIAIAVITLLICNLGLSTIISLAAPILSVICPVFMVTVVLLLFRSRIKTTWVFKGGAGVAILIGLILTVNDLSGALDFITYLPLYDLGFSWLIPSAIGALAGGIAGKFLDPRYDHPQHIEASA